MVIFYFFHLNSYRVQLTTDSYYFFCWSHTSLSSWKHIFFTWIFATIINSTIHQLKYAASQHFLHCNQSDVYNNSNLIIYLPCAKTWNKCSRAHRKMPEKIIKLSIGPHLPSQLLCFGYCWQTVPLTIRPFSKQFISYSTHSPTQLTAAHHHHSQLFLLLYLNLFTKSTNIIESLWCAKNYFRQSSSQISNFMTLHSLLGKMDINQLIRQTNVKLNC